MDNETKRPVIIDKGPTRIPLKHVHFREMLTIPGQGFGSEASCGDPGEGRPHLIAEFTPAIQAVRFEYKTSVVADRETFLVPCSAIVRMVLE